MSSVLLGKLAVGGAIVYVVASEKLWNKAVGNVPTVANNYVKEVAKVDKVDDLQIKSRMINNWNSGIQWVFEGLYESPAAASEYSKKALNQVRTKLMDK